MDNLITLLELADMRAVLGKRVKARREHLKIKKTALAIDSGVNRNAILAIEDGVAWPQYENLQTIAACLGVDVEYFFAEVESKPIKPTPEEALAILAEAVGVQATLKRKPEPADSSLLGEVIVEIRKLAALDETKLHGVLAAIKLTVRASTVQGEDLKKKSR